MKTKYILCLIISRTVLLSGCSTHSPAVISDGVISNPGIGWEGYSVNIPDGMEMIYPSEVGEKRSSEFYEFQTWYRMQQDPYGEDWYATFAERFLFKSPDHDYVIGFSCSTYQIHASWSALPNVRRNYLLNEMIRWKKILINDTEAESQLVENNGNHGWSLSGNVYPDFKKKSDPVAYEGYFLLGSLKEVYWIEAFGPPEVRKQMRDTVMGMVKSLTY